MPKQYDRDYFDTWYRDPEHSVASAAALKRKVALAVALAEHYLARPIRHVLDVGCGEAPWRAPLKALRPNASYRGLDASPYVVARYGARRDIGLATFAQLEHLRLPERYDLIVCSDVLHYLKAPEIRAGLAGVVEMLEGVAFLETFTREDDPDGDRDGFIARPARWYLAQFAQAGLLPCGSHGYLGPRLIRRIASLERAQLRAR